MSSSNEKIKRMRGYSPQTGRKYLQYTYLTEDLRQLIRNKEKIRHVKKEDILAVHKHEEVLHREMQIKTLTNYHYTPTRMAII